MTGMRPRFAAAAVVVATLFCSGPSLGQDAKARANAKALEKEANARFDKGDYAGSLEKFEAASALAPPAPPAQVRAARCMEKLGRLIAAAERFDAVAEAGLPEKASKADRDAQEEARVARTALEKRIPAMVLRVEGLEPLARVSVVLDDKPFPRTRIGVRHPLDPGEHKVEGVVDRPNGKGETAKTQFQITEGQSLDVALRFGDGVATAPPPGASEPQGAQTPPPAGGEPEDYWAVASSRRSTQRTIGWIVVGLGGAAALVGTGTTLAALSIKSDLDATCPKRKCPPPSHGDVDSYDTMKTLSTGLFIGSAAGVLVGIALLTTAPRARTLGELPAPRGVAWHPVVGPGSAGVAGAF